MQKVIRILHRYNSGDLVTLLAGCRQIYKDFGAKSVIYQQIGIWANYDDQKHWLTNEAGVTTTMNDAMFKMLTPLIAYQDYVAAFEVYKGEEVGFDTMKTRDSKMIPLPCHDIHHWNFFVFPEMACDLSEPWLTLPPSMHPFNDLLYSESVIINRTIRYRNPYVTYWFLKEYKDNLIFAGTEEEHHLFEKEWGFELPRLNVANFMELAQAINVCKFFIGSQSFCWHIADALKRPRILEVCPIYPNTLPTGKDGYAFLYQDALEMYFAKLFNR